MSLVEVLELAALVALVVALAWASSLLVPAPWSWPMALGVGGVLLLLVSIVIDRVKGGRG